MPSSWPEIKTVVKNVKNGGERPVDVRGVRPGRIGRRAVRLAARNIPLVWPCADCGEPATHVCAVCVAEDGNPFACAAHAKAHPCEEGEALRPVVNSPRMGVCGYGG